MSKSFTFQVQVTTSDDAGDDIAQLGRALQVPEERIAVLEEVAVYGALRTALAAGQHELANSDKMRIEVVHATPAGDRVAASARERLDHIADLVADGHSLDCALAGGCEEPDAGAQGDDLTLDEVFDLLERLKATTPD